MFEDSATLHRDENSPRPNWDKALHLERRHHRPRTGCTSSHAGCPSSRRGDMTTRVDSHRRHTSTWSTTASSESPVRATHRGLHLSLSLTRTHLCNPGAHRIISALKTKSAVFALNLGHNQLGDDGCRELLHYLRSNIPTTKIRKISMNGCDLGNVSLRLIGNYIAESPHLEELSLQNVRDLPPTYIIPLTPLFTPEPVSGKL